MNVRWQILRWVRLPRRDAIGGGNSAMLAVMRRASSEEIVKRLGQWEERDRAEGGGRMDRTCAG
jgi:hypothetical protein